MNRQLIKELRAECEQALSAIGTVLESRAGEHSEEISHVVRGMVRLRDRLIDAYRSQDAPPEASEYLRRVNSMLSAVACLEYPRGGLQWQRLHEVRDGLNRMLEDTANAA